MFTVVMFRPGEKSPHGVFVAADNHDAARQAYSAGEHSLADFFYRSEFFDVPPGERLRLPVTAVDGDEFWAFG